MKEKEQYWSEDTIKKAVEVVSSKNMCTYIAAEQFGIPRRTIRRYVLSIQLIYRLLNLISTQLNKKN